MSIKLKYKTDSVRSVEIGNVINVALPNTTKNIIHNSVVDKINARSLFEEERSKCNKYRLIFNIKPYCSNVLFNPFTEIVKYSKDEIQIKTDIKEVEINSGTTERVKYIQDTSISRCDMSDVDENKQGYEYYPGYDIFNNHILRDKSFKIVSNLNHTNEWTYNSLAEKMYDRNGEKIQIFHRLFDTEKNEFTYNKKDKHLYENENILNFQDGSAINERLIEDNGWFGFENACQIKTRENGKDIKIDKVINYKNGGDFIDMYPDRTLFSFNPKVNKFLNRLEYNWHYALTYPFACDKTHKFSSIELAIDDKNTISTTALKLMSIEKTKSSFGSDIILFRTYTKHGLNTGDTFRLLINPYGRERNDYKDDEKKYYIVLDNVSVSNLGDIKGENKDYFFTSENMNLLQSISTIVKGNGSDYDENGTNIGDKIHNWLYDEKGLFNDDVINDELNEHEFMINRMYNDIPSEYYFRLFKKIPNLKFKEENLTTDIVNDIEKYNTYLQKNKKIDFTINDGKLSFASSIYNDSLTQVIFSDDIVLENLIDNLGRPLTEFYLTIIKNNKGHDIWYDATNWSDGILNNDEEIKKIEYSHCFGKISCGLDFGGFGDIELRSQNGDINLLNELGVYNSIEKDENNKIIGYNKNKIGDYITIDGNSFKINRLNSNQTIVIQEDSGVVIQEDSGDKYYNVDEIFYGDFVEYNPVECKEKVLSPCYYRFNTYQREMKYDEEKNLYTKLCGWDILSDDYDIQSYQKIKDNLDKEYKINLLYDQPIEESGNFSIWERNYADRNNTYNLIEDNIDLIAYQKPEGYYYQPHYKFQIKELGNVIQDSHNDIDVTEARPIQLNGIFLSIKSSLKHKCVEGDKIFICDDDNNKWWYTYVISVINSTTFYIDKTFRNVDNENETDNSWIKNADYINNGSYKVRRENINIPPYAQRINGGQFVWREILGIGNSKAETLNEYPYLNESFYINKDINFYLKRQDTNGGSGLYSGAIEDSFPQDIIGNNLEMSNVEYKEESEMSC